MQQCLLLQGNLIHSGVTRGEKLVVLIGQRKALAMAVKSNRTENRLPGLLERLIVLEENRRPGCGSSHSCCGWCLAVFLGQISREIARQTDAAERRTPAWNFSSW
jgi:hypothetical protein